VGGLFAELCEIRVTATSALGVSYPDALLTAARQKGSQARAERKGQRLVFLTQAQFKARIGLCIEVVADYKKAMV